MKLNGDFWTDRDKIFEVLYLRRYLNELEIDDVAGSHNVLTAIFKKFGCQIRTLKISRSKIDDFTFREILKFCPILKEIHLLEVKIIKKLPAINPVCMTALQKIKVTYCDWEIFKFFLRSQIQSLTIKSYIDEGHRKDILRFLSFQRKLSELTLYGTALRSFFQASDINEICSFHLTSFKIDNGIGKNSDMINLNIITFLNKMEETLQNVEICGPHNEDVTMFSVLHLNNLKSLVIDVRNLTRNERFFEQLENEPKTLCLTTLKLVGFFFHLDAIKAILLKYPNIQELEVSDWGNGPISSLLNFISQNLIKLRSLRITEITNNEDIKLNTLQRLSVQYIGNARKLVNFMSTNNSVDTLDIGLIYIAQISEIGKDLKDLRNIKHLTIGGNKTALEKMLQSRMPERLETLQLALVNERDASQKVIKLKAPFDPMDLSFKFNVLI